jgi:Family of unknown function (DUF6519)
MRGTRYGDFSRFPQSPTARFEAVLMQQGRVQLDADWNAQAEFSQQLTARAISDLLGGNGAPAAAPGFAVYPVWALEFGGAGGLAIGMSGQLQNAAAGEQTVELWLTWMGGAGTLLDCRGAGSQLSYRLTIDADGVLQCTVATQRGTEVVAIAEGPLRPGVSTRIALVFGTGYVAIYAGASQLVRTSQPDAVLAPETLRVGVPGSLDGPGFCGTIAGLRIWASVRTPGELIDSALPWPDSATEPDLVGAWLVHGSRGLHDNVANVIARPIGEEPPTFVLADLDIGPGRYYVDGVICEQPRWFTYTGQPDLEPLPRRGRNVVFLETWEETLNALQAPGLREVALGGYDTTVRTHVRTRVRIAPLPSADPGRGEREPAMEAINDAIAGFGPRTTGRLAAEHLAGVLPGNHLYRVEIHADGVLPRSGTPDTGEEVVIVAIDVDRRELVLEELWIGSGSDEVEVVAIDDGGAVVIVTLDVETVIHQRDHTRIRAAGELDALTRLSRHRVRRRTRAAGFKWSRRNGSDMFAVAPVPAGAQIVRLLGRPQDVTPLAPGDVVELLDDPSPLAALATPLLTVVSVAPDGEVEISGRVPRGIGERPGARPYLRRWDHAATADGDGALKVTSEWTELEHGIQVRFEAGRSYARGDYWWIVAREDCGTIEWPSRHGAPLLRAPDGVERAVVPLALLDLRRGVHVRDLRRIFGPPQDGRVNPAEGDAPSGAWGGGAPVDPLEVDVGQEQTDEPDEVTGLEGIAVDVAADGTAADRDAAPEQGEGGTPPGEAAGDEDGWDTPPTDAWLESSAEPGGGDEHDAGSARGADPGQGAVETGWELTGVFEIARAELQSIGSHRGRLIATTLSGVWSLNLERASSDQLVRLTEGHRVGLVSVFVDELLLVFVGQHGESPVRTAAALDLDQRAWTERARMPRGRITAAAAAGRNVHVLLRSGLRHRHCIYAVDADVWKDAPRRGRTLRGQMLVEVGDRLHAIGGAHRSYDPRDGATRSETGLPDRHPVRDAVAHAGGFVVLTDAGRKASPPNLFAYDVGAQVWARLAELPEVLEQAHLAERAGRIIVAGWRAGDQLAVYEARSQT